MVVSVFKCVFDKYSRANLSFLQVPGFIKLIAPKGSLEIHEEAWNAYPYCKTVITNPGYMKENFIIIIESYHIGDRGDKENVHELPADKLKIREVHYCLYTI